VEMEVGDSGIGKGREFVIFVHVKYLCSEFDSKFLIIIPGPVNIFIFF